MKTKTFFSIIISFILGIVLYSCNATSYEIETTDDSPSQTTTTKTERSASEQAGVGQYKIASEKIDLNTTANNEKLSEPVEKYTIQIGAFTKEQRAGSFLEKARINAKCEFKIVLESGMYKVRTEAIDDKKTAQGLLLNIKSAGYKDSFIAILLK